MDALFSCVLSTNSAPELQNATKQWEPGPSEFWNAGCTPLSVLGYCLELLFQWKARHSSVNSISNQLLKPSLVSSADGLAFWKLWQVRSLQNEITSRYSRALQRAKADRPWISPVANHNWSSLLRSLVPCADVLVVFPILHTPNPHIQHLKIRGMGTKHCKPISKICKVVLVWWLYMIMMGPFLYFRITQHTVFYMSDCHQELSHRAQKSCPTRRWPLQDHAWISVCRVWQMVAECCWWDKIWAISRN